MPFGIHKPLLDVETAFCQLKSYLEVRPIFQQRTDRVRDHVRLCFVTYWLSACLGRQWRSSGEIGEGLRISRRLQTIRIGRLQVGKKTAQPLLTDVPKALNEVLEKLGLIKLFATGLDWTLQPDKCCKTIILQGF